MFICAILKLLSFIVQLNKLCSFKRTPQPKGLKCLPLDASINRQGFVNYPSN